jgi:hypothetical protein
MKPTIADAVAALHSNVNFSINNNKIVAWDISEPKTNKTQPTEAEIDAKLIELQAEYDALAWSRNRELEYPTVAELTISLFDTDDKAALETKRAAVKTKWPKDNSGPVE